MKAPEASLSSYHTKLWPLMHMSGSLMLNWHQFWALSAHAMHLYFFHLSMYHNCSLLTDNSYISISEKFMQQEKKLSMLRVRAKWHRHTKKYFQESKVWDKWQQMRASSPVAGISYSVLIPCFSLSYPLFPPANAKQARPTWWWWKANQQTLRLVQKRGWGGMKLQLSSL